VGYLGTQQAQSVLMDCLARLEYRGYDSAGMATLNSGKLGVRRSAGANSGLQRLLQSSPLEGNLGIAHTRWASHGEANDLNAHPHADCSGTIAIVHNGIIENYRELRDELESGGHVLASQTDSEIIAHLIERNFDGDLERAVMKSLAQLRGSYAIAVISQHAPEQIVIARHGGPPLVVGHSVDGLFIASDISAILHYSRDIQILEDGEIAVITRNGANICLLNGDHVTRKPIRISWEAGAADKGTYPHFMLKEIFEQPRAVMDTIKAQVMSFGDSISFPSAEFMTIAEFADISRLTILACGSSWHAGLIGKYLIESIAGVSVDVDIASEYRYRPLADSPDKLVIGISQSGETADTLAALKAAKTNGAKILAICNVVGSSIGREADAFVLTHAGPEIGVASTKTFTCQIASLALVAISLGIANKKLSVEAAQALLAQLMELPALIESVLQQNAALAELARIFESSTSALFLGRSIMYPIAVEGALKLKEVSYIHAEGYPAGELKHGPIALIDRNLPVVVIATEGKLYEKVLAAIQEVKARSGRVVVIATEYDKRISGMVDQVFHVPKTNELLMPILVAIPLQLLAYHVAVRRGYDVDKPRNLAKSVTVE
jgi:glucosamine--fructose-6-phosphate aminotransferase (isomerizing)